MAFSAEFAGDLLKLLLHGQAIASLAQNHSSPTQALYLALHTADPGAGGNQSTHEVNYTGYARVALQRSAAGWSITGNKATLASTVEFGEMTGGAGGTATHVSIGTNVSGTGKVLLRAALSHPIEYRNGSAARLRQSTSITVLTS